MDSDPAHGIIKASTDAAIDAVRPFLAKLVDPALDVWGGLVGDPVSMWRFKRQIAMLQEAERFLANKKIDPRRIALKTLVPILQEGSLEEDVSMQRRWVALLISSADPTAASTSAHPSYPRALSQITPEEAAILDLMADSARGLLVGVSKTKIREAVGISSDTFGVAVVNLSRLGLCTETSPDAENILYDVIERVQQEARRNDRLGVASHSDDDPRTESSIGLIRPPPSPGTLYLTEYGREFVRVCRKPE